MAHDPLHLLVHEATQPETQVIAVLHGHGDDPGELLQRVAGVVAADVTVIAPVGPVRTADGSPAWFVSAPGDGPERPNDTGTLTEAIHRLASTVESERSPTLVFGYSQGAATALALVFGATPEPRCRPTVVATIAGWLVADPDIDWDFASAASHTRARLLHAADDEVVDPQMGRGAARVLARAGVEVDLLEVPGGHRLTDDGIMRLLT
jgi:predicted esterase